MAGVNKVILLGHLGRDPEIRYMPDGTAVATSESYKDRDGNRQERTEWHRIALYARTAEVAGEYLRKGSQVFIEGRLRTQKWTDKDGQDRYTTEIIGDRMQMVSRRSGEADDGGQQDMPGTRHQGSVGGGASAPMDDLDDDEIPFVTQANILFRPRSLLRRVRF